jgi:hypothetical protein
VALQGAISVYTHEEMDQQVRLCMLDFFNLVLGAGPETDKVCFASALVGKCVVLIQKLQFWYAVVVPETQRKFRFAVNPRSVHRAALFLSLQYHVRCCSFGRGCLLPV